MPVVRGIRVLNAISTGNTTPGCLDTLLSDAGRLADVSQVLSSPQYACALSLSNTASHTLVRSNNAMTALFGNPIGSCVFHTTPNSRDDMLASSCYYNYVTAFATPEATCAFTHLGNSPGMLDCAFGSCTAFLCAAVSSNTDIDKMLTCNSCVSACFRGTCCSMKEATGTTGRASYWLSNATAFACLSACGLGTALSTTGFTAVLNLDMPCVMCTSAFQCCIYALAAPASLYTQLPCAMNEIITKDSCGAYETSCNFTRWANSAFGICCMTNFLTSGNTYFVDCMNSFDNFRQKACLYYLCNDKPNYYQSNICAGPTGACTAHRLLKAEVIGRGGVYISNNSVFPMSYYPHCNGQRVCPMTIANGSQLSNTEVEYLGRFVKCNYNTITHADCRFTMISPGFWNQSSAIACFRNCYCCSLDRTTANTSGLTLNCGLYYTTDNAATFNRLCLPLPACIFQQLCGNCCCRFTVRYALSSFACCNYVYTGWIISDCGTGFGAFCTPAYFKTGHSRMCLFANSQPNTASWTHFPDVPLPFYTIAFCDDYFAGVSPMRTDGFQSTLGVQNQLCCQCPGQYAMMFSFGKVGCCVRVSCDNFVRCAPAGLTFFDVCGCINACCSLPAVTHCTFNTCFEDYFQGHGSGTVPYCLCISTCIMNIDTPRIAMNGPLAASHTLIYKNSANTADSKAFLVGWRSFAMVYGGTADAVGCTCQMITGRSRFHNYNCCTCRGALEGLPYGCGYFRNTPGVNIWCYGSQANNTMEGSELDCLNAPAIGGTSTSWTNLTFANAKIIGCRLVLAGSLPPIMQLCACYSDNTGGGGSGAVGQSKEHIGGNYGCQNAAGQTGHTTVMNTDGVVGTIVCCFESMYNQTPFVQNTSLDVGTCTLVHYCNFCSGTCFCCLGTLCNCLIIGTRAYRASPAMSDHGGLKTLNFYGSSNSILSLATLPNMPPRAACLVGCTHGTLTGSASCYASPAPTGCQVMKSDKSVYCTIDAGDNLQFQFGCCCCPQPIRPTTSGFCCCFNPGVANGIAFTMNHHTETFAPNPCCYQAIYTPPNSNQLMTSFDSNYNFCYIITPHHDVCLGPTGVGPYCWLQQCECFGPNCCCACPCTPCCPNCNVYLCCILGCYCSQINCCIPACDIVRPTFTKQHTCVNYMDYTPSCMSPPRFCNTAIAGCPGFGNHHFPTAAANGTFQCAMAMTALYECNGSAPAYFGFCCADNFTCCMLLPYLRLQRTCNQSGSNCLWFDFISGSNPDWTECCVTPKLPSKTWWNSQYFVNINNCATDSTLITCGFTFITASDSRRTGFRFYDTLSQNCCVICRDGLCFPILYSVQTRGSGGPLNTQNSVHVAYFDLMPFKCCVPGTTSGIYANGNPCVIASAVCSCCLMFIKQDIFYNVN